MNEKEIVLKLKELKNSTDNKLEKYVVKDILRENEPQAYIMDVLNFGCQSGSVSQLIYYSDTKKFYTKFMDEIHELMTEMQEELGEPLKIGDPASNWLAWFGFEETMRKVADKIGLEL